MSQPDFIRTFARIGLLSFGGPAAQIALMHSVLVDEKKWLSERQFSAALSFCMLLPGPEAMQLATYAGWRLRGIRGGLQAGLLFILPGAITIYALALLYLAYGAQDWAQTLFLGIKAAVIIIVVNALSKLSRRTLRSVAGLAIAALSFVGLFLLALPYPMILAAAALAGALAFSADHTETSIPQAKPSHALALLTIGLTLWLAPLALAYASGSAFYTALGSYFAQLALLSFGGAYALLGWMTQTVVQDYGWITTTQMIDALGLAETTPGPLILVTQFVGHLAGYGFGGALAMLLAGLMALWMVFIPCFLYIFIGAPHIERLVAQPRLSGALSGITAAVTGVIASLALWFALSVLLDGSPGASTFQWPVLALIGTGAAIFWLSKHNVLALILGNALVALVFSALGLV